MALFGKKGGNSGGNSSGSGKAKNVPIVGILLTALSALIIPLWILAFLGWCVQLGGLAAVQYNVGRKFVQARVLAALNHHQTVTSRHVANLTQALCCHSLTGSSPLWSSLLSSPSRSTSSSAGAHQASWPSRRSSPSWRFCELTVRSL